MSHKFFVKTVVRGVERISEVSEQRIYDKAYKDFGDKVCEGGIPEALIWVQKVKFATIKNPIVLHEQDGLYMGIFAEEVKK